MFKQFCDKWDDKKLSPFSTIYRCKELKLESFIDTKMCNKYQTLWNDFVSIRINLINGKLRQFFANTLNIDKNKINSFYKCFEYHRTCYAYLPINCDVYSTPFNNSKDKLNSFSDMTNLFEFMINDDNIYRFMIIYNGIIVILNKEDSYQAYSGLSYKIKDAPSISSRTETKQLQETKTENKDNNNNSKVINNLCLLISNYICDQCTQTNIFGRYFCFTQDNKPWARKSDIENNDKIYNLCKKLLFDDSFDQLNELIKCCLTNNVSKIENYKNCDNEASLVSILVNEMTFIIFHDLTIDSLKKKNTNTNTNTLLLFPQLLKLFKFIYNLSCYIYCYPFMHVTTNESVYINSYFDLRNTLYKDIFDNIDNNNKQLSQTVSKLSNFNYFSFNKEDGTILHSACFKQYYYYCQILIKDGFDINKQNRKYDTTNRRWRSTPYTIAKEKDTKKTLSLMEKMENFNKASDLSQSQLQTSNMKSIENTSDLLYKQIMFGKYFLICCGINNVNDDYQIKSEKISFYNYYFGRYRYKIKHFMTDELYYSINQLKSGLLAITDHDDKKQDKKEDEFEQQPELGTIGNSGNNVMNGIISVVNKLINTKMVIGDDLLVLSWIYCQNNSNNSNNNSQLFLDNLLKCVEDCLSKKTDYSTRSYLYFKQFLLHSNIWYCKDYTSDNNNDKDKDKLLFDYVNELADKLLMEQKKYIQESIDNEEKKDNKNWNALCNFNKYKNVNNNGIQLRQDRIANGIKSIKNIKDGYSIATRIDNLGFDVLTELNDKVYLTQCLTFAHANKEHFDSEIKEIFGKDPDGLGTIRKAPVKLYDRCLVKSS